MIVLTVRTDSPEAEIALYKANKQLASKTWAAHKQLAETIHTNVAQLLKTQKLDWNDIEGLVCYKGPGSFTGLRIGLSFGNALAYSLGVPIVSCVSPGWAKIGLSRLQAGDNEKIALPEYGAPVHISTAKK